MRRYLPHIATILIIITIVIGGFGHEAYALSPCGLVPMDECMIGITATIVNTALSATAWILALAGSMLNMSINLTMHIKEFVNGTPAIYTIWKSIRDISGMFLIFTLLFAAIKMILAPVGVPGPSVNKLIMTVVMAGILINFSFFVAGLGIDVSNIVSMQLYKTIAPASNLSYSQLSGVDTNGDPTRQELTQRIRDGGISDIFMTSLKITNFYDAKTASLVPSGGGGTPKSAGEASFHIILGGIFGIVVMITAALSFFLAALAFIVRFVILILLLGFSPIWFAAYAIPDLKKYADKWAETYKGQLLFMPVYLLLMYFALSVLTSSNLFQTGFATNQTAGGNWWANFMILGINAVIVIVMLNAPLLAAISVGGKMTEWMDRGLGAGAIWKKVGGWTRSATIGTAGVGAGIAARHTLGTGAMALDKKLGNTRFFGDTVLGRDIRAATTGAVAKNKFGTARSAEDYGKVSGEAKRQGGVISRNENFKTALKAAKAGIPPVIGKTVKDTLKNMGEKEKLSLGTEALKDPEVIRHLKKNDFEAIKKADENDISHEDKQAIAQARKDTFTDAVTNNKFDVVKDMMKNMDIDDIADTPTHLLEDTVIANLKPDHLKKISENAILTDAQKRILGNKIDVWSSNTTANPAGLVHPAQVFVNKSSTNAAGVRVTEWL